MKKLVVLAIALTLFVSLSSCKKDAQQTDVAPQQVPNTQQPTVNAPAPEQANTADKIMATLNGQDITESQIMPGIQGQLLKAESEIYQIKRNGVDDYIDEQLLTADAKKQGTTLVKLVEKLKKKAGKVTEKEAQAFYDAQKAKFRNQPFDKIKVKLISDLTNQKQQGAVNDYIDGLRKKTKITYKMERPRTAVSIDDDPGKGNKDAPIVLIEFSDFQCPFCKRVRPTIAQVLSTYGKDVYYVFRDYPLGFHSQAKDAANAAECANEQNKYWDFNAELWNTQGQHTIDKLKEIGVQLGLDASKFNKCVDSKKYFAEIDKDQQDGIAAGVTGTPAYSINGIFVSGAQPFETFEQIIDEELARKKAK